MVANTQAYAEADGKNRRRRMMKEVGDVAGGLR